MKKREKRDVKRGCVFGKRREKGRRRRERNAWLSSESREPENERGREKGREKGRGREKERGGKGEQDDALGLVPVPDLVPSLGLDPGPDQDLVLGVEIRAEVGVEIEVEVGVGVEIGEGGDAE